LKTIQSKVLKDFIYPDILHPFIPKDEFILFDIETTGLSHTQSEVILIGYILFDGEDYVLHQIFCENRTEEKQLLETFSKALEDKSYYISFNGRAFDIPYTNSRYKHHGIQTEMNKSCNLDIMRLVKQNKDYFQFEDFKLKTVEKFLNIEREDTISGKESVELYNQYESTPTPELEHKILLHNYEDILYLMRCLEIVNHVEPSTLYKECPLSIPYKNQSLIIEDTFIKGDKLHVQIFAPQYSDKDYHDFISHVTKSYNVNTKYLDLTFPLFTLHVDQIKYQFVDTDLLELEDILFNDLTYQSKLNYLISESRKLMHQNIYRLVLQQFEVFQ